ncbi:MAG TPA: hypothetical protein VGM84_04300 [Steroidobacteraceae bacterium]|jgi:hypothetical protein
MHVHASGGAPIAGGDDGAVRRRCGHSLQYGVLMVLVGVMAGCSGGKSQTDAKAINRQSSAPSSGQGSAHIVYRPEVKTLDAPAARNALRGVSTNGLALVFDASASGIAALKAGDVLLVKNLMARKVLAVDQQGNEKIILTRLATLPEVATEAKISFRQPVHFGALRAKNSARQLPWLERVLEALGPRAAYAQADIVHQDPITHTPGDSVSNVFDAAKNGVNTTINGFKAVVEGWDTEFDATPEDGKLHLTMKLTRTSEATNVVAEIDADGYLQDYDTMLDAAMSGGSMNDLTGSFKNINGSMYVTWKIGQKTKGAGPGQSRIDFPTVVATSLAPLLDGLPLFLEIKGSVIVNPVTTGANEYASGSYRLTYDGYQNFKLHGTAFDSDGPVNMKIDSELPTGVSLAPTASVVALAAPIVQISFGGPALDVFKVGDLADAADTVNKWADKVAKQYLPPDLYGLFQDTSDLLAKSLKAVQNTGAMVDMRVVTTTTHMQSGSATMFPCQKETWQFVVYVGATAQALGIPAGSYTKKIGEKEFHRANPPNNGLCSGGPS